MFSFIAGFVVGVILGWSNAKIIDGYLKKNSTTEEE